MTSGYSGTPLFKKLGIKPTTKLFVIDAPENYFEWLPMGSSDQQIKSPQKADLLHLFVRSKKEYETRLQELRPCWQSNPEIIIWVSWFKKSAQVPTDLTETDVRSLALRLGLVDIKVCAVTEQWSGLKLVVPKSMR
jgi:hypothetical protein